ncbi:hypothetical protein BH20ACT17_BH20ACT17_17990 [soil metagenome]
MTLRGHKEITLPLEWIDFDETPILFANHFLAQHQLEEFLLSMGLARVGLMRHRMVELIASLQNALEERDQRR